MKPSPADDQLGLFESIADTRKAPDIAAMTIDNRTSSAELQAALNMGDIDQARKLYASGHRLPELNFINVTESTNVAFKLSGSRFAKDTCLAVLIAESLPPERFAGALLSTRTARFFLEHCKNSDQLRKFVAPDILKRVASTAKQTPVVHLPRQEDGSLRPIIIKGRPGTGKTAFGMAIIPGADLTRIPCGGREAADFTTYKVPVKSADGTRAEIRQLVTLTTIQDFSIDKMGDNYGIIQFDDLGAGNPEIDRCLHELLHKKRYGDITLGKNVLIVITTNSSLDGSYAHEISSAVTGRCVVLDWEPSLENWLLHEDQFHASKEVVAFLVDKQQDKEMSAKAPNFFAPYPEAFDDESAKDEVIVDPSGKCPSPRDYTELGFNLMQQGGFAELDERLKLEAYRFGQTLYADATAFVASMIGHRAAKHFVEYTTSQNTQSLGQVWGDAHETLSKSLLKIKSGMSPDRIADILKGAIEELEGKHTLFDLKYQAAAAATRARLTVAINNYLPETKAQRLLDRLEKMGPDRSPSCPTPAMTV